MNKEELLEATINALQEELDGQVSFDENGLPNLEYPYTMRERDDGKLQITSSHPYDLTDYSWAYSVNLDPNSDWVVIDPDKDVKDVVHGWNDALDKMKEIDATKVKRIDRT